MPVCKEQIMAQIQELEAAPKESQMDMEHREQLLKCICQLMQLDLVFGLQNQVPHMLWCSQKLLFNGVREHYLKVIKQPARAAASEDGNKAAAIARLNCTNVLHTLYSEWFKLAMLVESVSDSCCSLLPLQHNGSAESLCSQLLQQDEGHPIRKFAEVLYTRLGDINRYMNDFELSKKFYKAVQRLDPFNQYSLNQLDRLAKLSCDDNNKMTCNTLGNWIICCWLSNLAIAHAAGAIV